MQRLLDKYHKDHYKVYNFANEAGRSYPEQYFQGRVERWELRPRLLDSFVGCFAVKGGDKSIKYAFVGRTSLRGDSTNEDGIAVEMPNGQTPTF